MKSPSQSQPAHGKAPVTAKWVWMLLAVMLLFGLWTRIVSADRYMMHPDECMHIEAAAQPDLWTSYKFSTRHAHPPLYFLLLSFWYPIDDGELFLRLPSVLSGVLFPLVLFFWLSRAFSTSAGLIAAAIATLNPFLIEFSSEVRAYSWVLMTIAAALLTLYEYVRSRHWSWFAAHVVFLICAVLSHYAAFFAAFGVAVAWLVLAFPLSRRDWARWFIVQGFILSLFVLLYFTHVSALRGSGMETVAQNTWLGPYYYTPQQQSMLGFFLRQSTMIATMALGIAGIGLLPLSKMLPLGAVTLVILITAGLRIQYNRHFWAIALGTAAALCSHAASSLLHLFPFGPTRHSTELWAFLIPLAAIVLAHLLGRKLLWACGLCLVYCLFILRSDNYQKTKNLGQEATPSQARNAAETLRGQLRPGDAIVTVDASRYRLSYYLPPRGRFASSPGPKRATPVAGVEMYNSSVMYLWIETADWPVREIRELSRQSSAPKRIWLVAFGESIPSSQISRFGETAQVVRAGSRFTFVELRTPLP